MGHLEIPVPRITGYEYPLWGQQWLQFKIGPWTAEADGPLFEIHHLPVGEALFRFGYEPSYYKVTVLDDLIGSMEISSGG